MAWLQPRYSIIDLDVHVGLCDCSVESECVFSRVYMLFARVNNASCAFCTQNSILPFQIHIAIDL